MSLDTVAKEDVEFRRTLPKNMYDFLGAIHFENDTPDRENFTETMSALLQKMMEGLTMDDAADSHFKQFTNRRQPPVLLSRQLAKGKNYPLEKIT